MSSSDGTVTTRTRACISAPPVKGQHNDRWTLTASRRLSGLGGQFAGMVVATIDAELFSQFYASFDVGPQGSVVLTAADSTLLVRHPPIPGRIGTRNAALEANVAGQISGDRISTSPLDGVLRYSSFHRTDGVPLIVFVTRSEADVLRQWRRDSIIVCSATAAIVLALAFLGWRLAQQIRQRQRSEAAVRESEYTHRLLAEGGHYIWVEGNGRRLPGTEGFLVSMRDITLRKQAQEQLHDANNHLRRLMMQDGLTGIANRRCLDIMLDKEFRRAARSELPMSLLLIDVDHFKAFNDAYGHPEGDACLCAIWGSYIPATRTTS